MRRSVAIAAILGIAFFSLTPAASHAEGWHGHIAIASEYSYRGLLISEDNIVPSLMVEYQHQSGLYGGMWAAALGSDSRNRGGSEVDYLLGFARELNGNLAFDTSLIRYTYPSTDSSVDYDWEEWLLSLHWRQQLTLTVGVNNNWFARNESARLLELTYRYVLPLETTGDVSYGYAEIERIFGIDYQYYELGLNKSLGGLRLRAAITGTDDNGRDWFGPRNMQSRFLFSAAWGF